jgi:hypothetical protein
MGRARGLVKTSGSAAAIATHDGWNPRTMSKTASLFGFFFIPAILFRIAAVADGYA